MENASDPNEAVAALPVTTATARAAEDFFIVGIGASAGGLEAVTTLLQRITIEGAAFVVVQHLASDQTKMLAQLLVHATSLPVVMAVDGMPIGVDVVHVMPPNGRLAVVNGVVRVSAPATAASSHMPIDAFFRSLAEVKGNKALGIVLSGMGTDGSFGLAAIKAAGGITFVQDPSTAKCEGMPRSVLETRGADFCLSPEAIADELPTVASHSYIRRTTPSPEFQEHVCTLAILIKSAFGTDLSHYKSNIVERRLRRRMAVHRLERFDDYIRLCRSDAKELSALHKDMLINVTRFFRDGEPFDILRERIFPAILDRKHDDASPIRLWVPACSTGEEAYSVAICLLEVLEARGQSVAIKLFGTDLDPDAVGHARQGLYPGNIVADVSPERLKRSFIKTHDGCYQIARSLRESVVFSVQNISRDPPFSRLDFVSCRNLMIYFQPWIQKQVLRTLHYALEPRAVLMLGTSESVGDSVDLFSLVDRKNKFYAAKHVAVRETACDLRAGPIIGEPRARPLISIAKLADRKILEQHAPPGVVVNENLEILYFRGQTDRYLRQPSGLATHSILKLVRQGLHAGVRQAIDQVLANDQSTTVEARVKSDDARYAPVVVVAHPMLDPASRARCVLVLFKGVQAVQPPCPNRPNELPLAAETGDDRVRLVEQELALTKEFLQTTVEELERTNEDLKSSNEELQSSMAELQSTNEALQTSKEEMQSSNEELLTLNNELQCRMRDLSSTNNDLQSVLLGVDRAVLIVGLDLRIRRFTQAARKLLNLVSTDVGRPASVLSTFLGGLRIERVLADAIENVSTVEREVLATDRRWYHLRVIPYRTLDLCEDGAVVSISDIDISYSGADEGGPVGDYAADILSAIPQPLIIVNRELEIVWVNEAYCAVFQLLPHEVIGSGVGGAGSGHLACPEVRRRIEHSFESGMPFRNHEHMISFPDSGCLRVLVSGNHVRRTANQAALVVLSFEGNFGASALAS